jgi:hypothetical protein
LKVWFRTQHAETQYPNHGLLHSKILTQIFIELLSVKCADFFRQILIEFDLFCQETFG